MTSLGGSGATREQAAPNYDAVFQASFERVLGNGAYNPDFIRDFYDDFLAASPIVRDKFAQTNMSAQRTMLHDSLLLLIEFNRTRSPDNRLLQLAQVHSRAERAIAPEFYDLWLASLVNAVARHDPQFGPDVDLAWRMALAPGICFMRFYY